MAKDYAKGFYNSKAWERCRAGYMQSQYYICERCGDMATVCHHKEYITPANIGDPNITLNWSNLEAVCSTCHANEHHGSKTVSDGLAFNSNGELIKK